MTVKMFTPRTLVKAYCLAKLQEIIMAALKEQLKHATKTTLRIPLIHKNPYQNPNINNFLTGLSNSTSLLPTLNTPRLSPPNLPPNQKKKKTATNNGV